MKFRKKPVVIEARQWDGSVKSGHAIVDWVWADMGTDRGSQVCGFGPKGLWIKTLESGPEWNLFIVSPKDWVIRGVAGEFYPIKPDIFAETYEPAERAESGKDK